VQRRYDYEQQQLPPVADLQTQVSSLQRLVDGIIRYEINNSVIVDDRLSRRREKVTATLHKCLIEATVICQGSKGILLGQSVEESVTSLEGTLESVTSLEGTLEVWPLINDTVLSIIIANVTDSHR
jgi:hypothetical protein